MNVRTAVSCLVALPCLLAVAEEPAAPRDIALTVFGKVDAALVERVKGFVHDQFGAAVVVREAAAADAADADAMRAALAKTIQPQDVCIVGLAAGGAAVPFQGTVDPLKHAGIINVDALAPAGKEAAEVAEAYGRRVEKETTRAVALLLGLPPCPVLRCCLFHHRSDEELDAKSRNPCPPCLARARKALAGKGALVEAPAAKTE